MDDGAPPASEMAPRRGGSGDRLPFPASVEARVLPGERSFQARLREIGRTGAGLRGPCRLLPGRALRLPIRARFQGEPLLERTAGEVLHVPARHPRASAVSGSAVRGHADYPAEALAGAGADEAA